MIIEKTGDILEADELLIGIQVSCTPIINVGLMHIVKVAYPQVYNSYDAACRAYNRKNLGNCLCLVADDSEHVFALLYGQDAIGFDMKDTNYEALRNALNMLLNIAVHNNDSIALPYGIGCNEANGDWDVVYKIIEETFSDYDVTIYKNED